MMTGKSLVITTVDSGLLIFKGATGGRLSREPEYRRPSEAPPRLLLVLPVRELERVLSLEIEAEGAVG